MLGVGVGAGVGIGAVGVFTVALLPELPFSKVHALIKIALASTRPFAVDMSIWLSLFAASRIMPCVLASRS